MSADEKDVTSESESALVNDAKEPQKQDFIESTEKAPV